MGYPKAYKSVQGGQGVEWVEGVGWVGVSKHDKFRAYK